MFNKSHHLVLLSVVHVAWLSIPWFSLAVIFFKKEPTTTTKDIMKLHSALTFLLLQLSSAHRSSNVRFSHADRQDDDGDEEEHVDALVPVHKKYMH